MVTFCCRLEYWIIFSLVSSCLLFTVKISSLAPTVVRLRDYLTFINVAYQNHATLQFTPDCLINIIFSVFLLRQNSFELFRFWSNLEKLFQGKNTSEEIPYKCENTDLLNRPTSWIDRFRTADLFNSETVNQLNWDTNQLINRLISTAKVGVLFRQLADRPARTLIK